MSEPSLDAVIHADLAALSVAAHEPPPPLPAARGAFAKPSPLSLPLYSARVARAWAGGVAFVLAVTLRLVTLYPHRFGVTSIEPAYLFYAFLSWAAIAVPMVVYAVARWWGRRRMTRLIARGLVSGEIMPLVERVERWSLVLGILGVVALLGAIGGLAIALATAPAGVAASSAHFAPWTFHHAVPLFQTVGLGFAAAFAATITPGYEPRVNERYHALFMVLLAAGFGVLFGFDVFAGTVCAWLPGLWIARRSRYERAALELS